MRVSSGGNPAIVSCAKRHARTQGLHVTGKGSAYAQGEKRKHGTTLPQDSDAQGIVWLRQKYAEIWAFGQMLAEEPQSARVEPDAIPRGAENQGNSGYSRERGITMGLPFPDGPTTILV
jgi:hypothetical protein